jgi:hypothetical protein
MVKERLKENGKMGKIYRRFASEDGKKFRKSTLTLMGLF